MINDDYDGSWMPELSGDDLPVAASDPVKDWEADLAALEDAGLSREQAIRLLVRGDPELHRQYLETVTGRERKRRASRKTAAEIGRLTRTLKG